jgi:hypothetical protein
MEGRKEKFGSVMIRQMMGNGTRPVPAQAGSITGVFGKLHKS